MIMLTLDHRDTHGQEQTLESTLYTRELWQISEFKHSQDGNGNWQG